MPILSVEGYTKHFHIDHLDRDLPVFSDLDFDVAEGQFLLVSGPNGIGKSTLLRCLYRSYRPTSGQAIFQSRYGAIDLARAADADIALLRREEIGFVSQFLRPRPRVSALELVTEPLLVSGVGWEEAAARAREILSGFGLNPELWNAYPTTFSGGEQQKVNLARALIRPFRLLLLDEPTASLDRSARASLTSWLIDLKRQGITLIGIFHHPEEIHRLIDGEIHLTGAGYPIPDTNDREISYVAQ
jgi:alpha-D-ribose 1-methylphosphonate 5-triphosphate synthase subunit PhnL